MAQDVTRHMQTTTNSVEQIPSVFVYDEEFLASHQTPKLEDYPLPAVCDCPFNIFSATIHI